jgi:hypothetical protein
LIREAVADKAIDLPKPVRFLERLDEAIALLTADPPKEDNFSAVTEAALRRIRLADLLVEF